MEQCCFNCKHYSHENGYCTYHQDWLSKDDTFESKSRCPAWDWDANYDD